MLRLGFATVSAACALLVPVAALPQVEPGPARAADAAGDELIATLRTNGVVRGDFTLLRRPDGDFWIAAGDLPALKIEPLPAARREVAGQAYYSARSLGARRVNFDEALLTLDIEFAPEALQPNVLDVSRRARPDAGITVAPDLRSVSLILSYRLALQHGTESQATRVSLDNDLNVRVGPVLLRQEARLDTGAPRRFVRGVSQALWDDRPNARRWAAGDVVSSAGPYGSTIPGAGLLLTKLYDLAPDVFRHPTATLHATAVLPSQVEVAVDGNTVYRSQVAPGPVTLTNLVVPRGRQNVTVTVTDPTGRREVSEQPFFFTDDVLGAGFHEYSYFVGRRSELAETGEIRYREAAWQGYHRYGVTNSVTVSGGGEGNQDFASGGAGLALRSDRLGLLSVDLLGSADRRRGTRATGWAARYTYLLPWASFVLGKRRHGDGFRNFQSSEGQPPVSDETLLGVGVQFGRFNVSGNYVRSRFPAQRRELAILRAGTRATRDISISGEYQRLRVNDRVEWRASVFVRAELDGQRWVNQQLRAGADRGYEVELGKLLPAGEGVGYRIGASAGSRDDTPSYGYAAAEWNLRAATLDGAISTPVRGRGPSFGQVGISGAFAALGGYWGMTRRITDSFAVASVGVPQQGIEILMNNQVQGRTDAEGKLLIPQVGSFGRQEVALNDKQLDIQYTLAYKLRTITPPYRSGTLVEFGGRRLRAVAGMAWIVRDGARQPVESRAWSLAGAGGALAVETGKAGDFYLEDVTPGTYRGMLRAGQETYSCRVTIPDFQEPVLELQEGILCE